MTEKVKSCCSQQWICIQFFFPIGQIWFDKNGMGMKNLIRDSMVFSLACNSFMIFKSDESIYYRYENQIPLTWVGGYWCVRLTWSHWWLAFLTEAQFRRCQPPFMEGRQWEEAWWLLMDRSRFKICGEEDEIDRDCSALLILIEIKLGLCT